MPSIVMTSKAQERVEEAAVPGSVPEYGLIPRVMTAVLYALCASLIVIVNKLVLTSYKFPSFLTLGLGQMVITLVVLFACNIWGVVRIPSPSKEIFIQVWPLPLFYFGNIVFSLGGTQRLSLPMYIALRKLANLFVMIMEYFLLGLPMYIVLRRFANLFIMIGEYCVLGVVATRFIQFTVYLMILGAFIAASGDLSFDLMGYIFIFCTNLTSSASGVYTKKKLNNKRLGKYGLMFYNSLVTVIPTGLLAYSTGDLHQSWQFQHWGDALFRAQFLLACVFGFLVNYATLLCVQYNSALTTSIVGVLKNVVIVYAGMFIGGDYVFSFVNFFGINVSVIGGLMYSYATFISKPKAPDPVKV